MKRGLYLKEVEDNVRKMLIDQVAEEKTIPLSVIEDIKAEIDENIQDCQLPQGHYPWWNGRKDGLKDALEIIETRITKMK